MHLIFKQTSSLPSTLAAQIEFFENGQVLLIDKPLGWTSFDVVSRIHNLLRKRLGLKKLKVGHAGTLDPLATGLLIVCVGKYTKLIDQIQAETKVYTGSITFGATTASYDLEKAPQHFIPTDTLTDALLSTARQAFIGDILQIPPIYSAVKVDGQRLYKNARTGEAVELPHRPIRVDTFDLSVLHPASVSDIDTAVQIGNRAAAITRHPNYKEGVQAEFEVVCGKGTYIRSLAHDLGEAVGCGAFLSSLRRTKSGDFSVEDAWDIDVLAQTLNNV